MKQTKMFFKPKSIFALVVLVLCLVPFNEVYGKPHSNSDADFELEQSQYQQHRRLSNWRQSQSSDRYQPESSESEGYQPDSQNRDFQIIPRFSVFPTHFPFPYFPSFPQFSSGEMGQNCPNRKFGCNSGSCWETCDSSSSGPSFQSSSKRYRSSSSSSNTCSTDMDCQSF